MCPVIAKIHSKCTGDPSPNRVPGQLVKAVIRVDVDVSGSLSTFKSDPM